MPPRISKLTPPMSFHMAIYGADLKVGPKAVCWSLLALSDWTTGAGVKASVAAIAAGAGLGCTATRSSLKQLERLGVVVYVRRSAGGVLGRNLVHELRLELSALLRLNPSESEGFHPADSEAHPSGIGAQTLRNPTVNPPDSEDIQKSKMTEPLPQQVGGRGIDARGRDEDQDPLFDDLVEFGVAINTVRKIVGEYGRDTVAAGLEWVQQHAREAESPAAVFLSRLRDGTAAAVLDARRRRDNKRLLATRTGHLAELRKWTYRTTPAEQTDKLNAAWECIDRAWGGDLGTAAACPVPDELLNGRDGRAAFQRLLRAARVAQGLVDDLDFQDSTSPRRAPLTGTVG